MRLVETALIPIINLILEQEAIKDWDENHILVRSEAVIDGIVSVHKDTLEPCAKNPCRQALLLQELGINMETL